MLGSLILYLKGMRLMMFQLSGFYFKALRSRVWGFESRELNWGLGFGAVRNLGFNVGT